MASPCFAVAGREAEKKGGKKSKWLVMAGGLRTALGLLDWSPPWPRGPCIGPLRTVCKHRLLYGSDYGSKSGPTLYVQRCLLAGQESKHGCWHGLHVDLGKGRREGRDDIFRANVFFNKARGTFCTDTQTKPTDCKTERTDCKAKRKQIFVLKFLFQ